LVHRRFNARISELFSVILNIPFLRNHSSHAVQHLLRHVKDDLFPEELKNYLSQTMPNPPEQNPLEVFWLQVRQFIRQVSSSCKRFKSVKFMFKFFRQCPTFAFPNACMYGYCSCLTEDRYLAS
jgi:hypothetical protein